tara:strand:+ start:108 stop:1241 length:1134 start_codon:yes stop_codon:yes gene_type:complete
MLNKIKQLIVSFIDYFRLARHDLHSEFKFFYDPPPKKVAEIQDYESKLKIVSEILKFNTKCNYFYENLSICQELKIEGLWKGVLLDYKKKQLDTYLSKNTDQIMLMHEGMFYNYLINGLIGYSNFKDIKFNPTAKLLFLKDLGLYKIIFRNFDSLPSNNYIKKWGYKNKNNKINFCDASSMLQKNLILNSLKLLNKREKYNIMEIGGGFGSLAERLFEEDKISSLILLDIPSTLITAFYYLSSKFGLDKVKILNSPSDVEKYYNLNDTKKILLIPTCYYDLIKNIKDINLLCNFHSFSEMNFDTIKFYLQNMPEEVKIIVSANSNIAVKTKDHLEVISDKFPIPKKFDLVFSNIDIPYFVNWRYKTCVWLNKSLPES